MSTEKTYIKLGIPSNASPSEALNGLLEHKDSEIRKSAERARNNLVKIALRKKIMENAKKD